MPTTTAETKELPKTKSLEVKVSTKAVEGESTVVFVASSPREDRDYESVDVESLRLPLKGGGYIVARDLTGNEAVDMPLLLNHSFDVEDVIGSVRKAYLNEQGELVFEAGIASRAKAQDMLSLLKEDHLSNAFSITMIDYEYDWNTNRIFNAEVAEVSLVFRGSNKEARLLQVKSLLKQGKPMSTDKATELAEKKAQLEALQKEIDEAEAQAVTDEKPVETEAEKPVDKPDEATDKPTEAEAAGEAANTDKPVTEDGQPVVEAGKSVEKDTEDSNSKSLKGDKEMANETAKDAVVEKQTAPKQGASAKQYTKDDFRTKFVLQVIARQKGEFSTLQQLNKEVADMEGKSKAIDFSDGASLFQSEVVSQDILLEYNNLGNVGALVNKVDILGAEKWKRPVMTSGNGFRPVGDEESKQEDQPTFSALFVEPKEHALIVAWYDAVARRTPLAVYQTIVRYIANEYRKLEDRIVLSFAGTTTTGGDVFPATGLVPLLNTAGRVVDVADYSSAAVVAALGEAYGEVESDATISLVANRRTWGRMAVAVDGEGRPIFTVVGNQVNAGALGTFNVVVSQEAPDDVAVVGAFGDYDLVTRGAMETLFSREATVGNLNLFTDDASALRANVDIAGKPARVNSFTLLDFGGLSS